ncbi:unnamed protein product [Oppiella nova]|uniref:Splicing factor U2af 38 kDa subunit n=1 Tax=Oppiella nova TaxID=334625 RepID=A0A7R9LWT3_9ACAR|nr:unnamed protein product [Oppiella nova]CAG2167686.1 unnamed protein product [Oppiella nova]
MAEYLASIFGTEKDKVNCSFYFKIGACRHGDRCSRIHNKPTFSQTLLLQNLYQNPQNVGQSADGNNVDTSGQKMAEYLASIFGTEKDKVNCSFYFKIGACRHGDRCSRIHNKPTFSQTLLLQNLYQNPQNVGQSADGNNDIQLQGIKVMSDAEAQEHFDNFFEDVFIELEDKYGEIEEMNVCDNLGDHLVGNVYVKFRREEDADKAQNELNNRWFGGRPIYAELSPVTDFREACCRQYEMGECTRSGFCNFMHLKPISRDLRRELYGRRRAAAIERRLASYVTGRSRSRSLSPIRRRSRSPRERRRIIYVTGRSRSRSLSPIRRRSRSPRERRRRSGSGERRNRDRGGDRAERVKSRDKDESRHRRREDKKEDNNGTEHNGR